MVVVGAHLLAEEFDRPIAYALADRIRTAARACLPPGTLRPLVCTDLWWLNDAALRERPTISIGSPDVNALSAYLADKLPSAYAIDDSLMVQLDVEFTDPLAVCWGIDPVKTATAVELFCEKYLESFLGSIMV